MKCQYSHILNSVQDMVWHDGCIITELSSKSLSEI